MNKLMRIEWVIECHSSASKSPWNDCVIHALKMVPRCVFFSFPFPSVEWFRAYWAPFSLKWSEISLFFFQINGKIYSERREVLKEPGYAVVPKGGVYYRAPIPLFPKLLDHVSLSVLSVIWNLIFFHLIYFSMILNIIFLFPENTPFLFKHVYPNVLNKRIAFPTNMASIVMAILKATVGKDEKWWRTNLRKAMLQMSNFVQWLSVKSSRS